MTRWITAAVLTALLCLGAMTTAMGDPGTPSGAALEVEDGKVMLTWSPPPPDNVIVQSGCTATNLSMGPVAAAFMAEHPSFDISLTGGTNALAFTSWTSGSSDIAQASRAIDAVERTAAEREGLEPVDIMVGAEAVAVVVNPALGIPGLNMEQLRGIYNGSIESWSDAGGPDVPVQPVGAQWGTNAYNLVSSMVLSGDRYAVMSQYDDADVPNEVRSREGGIGFLLSGKLPSGAEDMVIGVSATESGRYVEADDETVFSSAYPLSRTLHLVTDGEPDGAVGTWIGYVLGADEGQRILADNGFFALSDSDREDALGRIAGTMDEQTSFYIYRTIGGEEERFITNSTSFVDETPPQGVNITYEISPVIGGVEGERSSPMVAFVPAEAEAVIPGPEQEGSDLLPLVAVGAIAACAVLVLSIRKR